MKIKKKFQKGDIVFIERLPQRSDHFPQLQRAVVKASYSDKYGGSHDGKYTLVLDCGEVSWFHQDYLTLVRKGNFPSWKEYVKRELSTP